MFSNKKIIAVLTLSVIFGCTFEAAAGNFNWNFFSNFADTRESLTKEKSEKETKAAAEKKAAEEKAAAEKKAAEEKAAAEDAVKKNDKSA